MPTVNAVTFTIVGVSPLSFGRPIQTPREAGEDHNDYDQRVWRERCHTNGDKIFIPPTMMKKCVDAAAAQRKDAVPGKKGATFTKFFLSGTMITDPIILHMPTDRGKLGPELSVETVLKTPERVYCNADGKKNSGTRVWRHFPHIPQWAGIVHMHILDPTLQSYAERIEEYAIGAGQFVGLGRWAPRVGGYYGRFNVIGFKAG